LEKTLTELGASKEAATLIKNEADKLMEVIKVKDDEIAFLRGHVSQLTQSISQLSLPPTKEEGKKGRSWRFWQRTSV
jgi:hypothetical protein